MTIAMMARRIITLDALMMTVVLFVCLGWLVLILGFELGPNVEARLLKFEVELNVYICDNLPRSE